MLAGYSAQSPSDSAGDDVGAGEGWMATSGVASGDAAAAADDIDDDDDDYEDDDDDDDDKNDNCGTDRKC
ncbi:hypothetical protein DPMN_102447 [Dreissena polymorpha]|uniref:Uncharacterized protein n=1 Tax=Dreissena polymorpha TaxID=45954 RepID=A0A9D4LKZ0_DREPO|nr:hypothetical protein DPMN_102447 [Dreissena polymorpha]